MELFSIDKLEQFSCNCTFFSAVYDTVKMSISRMCTVSMVSCILPIVLVFVTYIVIVLFVFNFCFLLFFIVDL